eukprot:PLAT7181.1.p1 GENE.PLAT7181.1~~PLAT7181.1.p1  ORF type:complete len:412 (+),score=193.09 PLAT7181.1:97-1236(+)
MFDGMLRSSMSEAAGGVCELADCTDAMVAATARWIGCGAMHAAPTDAAQLLQLAHRLSLPSLLTRAARLARHAIDHDSAAASLLLAHQLDLPLLQQAAAAFIYRHALHRRADVMALPDDVRALCSEPPRKKPPSVRPHLLGRFALLQCDDLPADMQRLLAGVRAAGVLLQGKEREVEEEKGKEEEQEESKGDVEDVVEEREEDAANGLNALLHTADGAVVRAHGRLISARLHDWLTAQEDVCTEDDRLELVLPADVTSAVLPTVLSYVYTAQLGTAGRSLLHDSSRTCQLLSAAAALHLPALAALVEEALLRELCTDDGRLMAAVAIAQHGGLARLRRRAAFRCVERMDWLRKEKQWLAADDELRELVLRHCPREYSEE